jgi:hypothetical protein
MKTFYLFTVALLLAFCGYAQPAQEKGYVFLRNGTILKGKYFYDDSGKLRVESAGNIWVFDASEVERVAARRDVRMDKMEQTDLHSRFFYRAEMGVLAGNAQNSQSAPFSLTGSVNYVVTPWFSAGAGAGAEFFKETYLPAFINSEFKLHGGMSSPYLFVKAGYQLPLEDSREAYYGIMPYQSSIWPGPVYNEEPLDARGGILVNPGVGFSHMVTPGVGFSLAFGYQFHRLSYAGKEDYSLDVDFNRLTIKVGIIFN